MNKYEKQFRINRHLCHVRPMNRQKNTLRWGCNESDEHIGTKLEVAKCLKRMNIDFVTEAIFVNGMRCDVFDLLHGYCFEIWNTESEESLLRKENEYGFLVVRVKAGISKEEVQKIVGEI